MKLTTGDKIFLNINYLILTLVAIITLYPFVYVVSASLSDPSALAMGKVSLFPVGFSFEAYKQVAQFEGIWMAYANSILYTVVGTAVSLFLTTLGAYPLAKKRLRGRKIFTFIFSFVMWFHVGMIPYYLNLKALNLMNSRLGIFLIFAVASFYLFILRTAFAAISDSLEESAKIDGANDFIIAFKIYLPLVLPTIATVGLFYAVSRWNSFFWPMILLKDNDKIPLQVLLRKIIVDANVADEMGTAIAFDGYSKETLIYSTIVIAILPMIALYPFIQKFFTKGVMVGSVKE